MEILTIEHEKRQICLRTLNECAAVAAKNPFLPHDVRRAMAETIIFLESLQREAAAVRVFIQSQRKDLSP